LERLNRGLAELLFADSFDERGGDGDGISLAPGQCLAELVHGYLVELIVPSCQRTPASNRFIARLPYHGFW
jgi:hypothetical protein